MVSCEACCELCPSRFKERLTVSLSSFEYYFVVEGYEDMEGNYEILADCVNPPPSPPPPTPPDISKPPERLIHPLQCEETVTGDTSEIGHRNRMGNPSAEAWLSFQRPGKVTIDLCNSAYDTVLHVLDANSLAVLATCDEFSSPGGVVESCEACPSNPLSERLTTLFLSSMKYYFVVEGYGDKEGNYEIRADCVYAPPSLPPPVSPSAFSPSPLPPSPSWPEPLA